MYVRPNFLTKKALKEAVKGGLEVTVVSPGLGMPKENGREYIEGPHYPKRHTWYAAVEVKHGRVIKVLS